MTDESLADALTDPNHQFTRAEIAELIAAAFRWGYEHRVDEENATYPPPPIMFRGQWWDQAEERRRHDAETARLIAQARP
jgi:hypothetical protein